MAERTGILAEMLKGTPLASLGVTPRLAQNDIVIEITAEQLKKIALQGLDERAKRAIEEGAKVFILE